MGKEKKFRYPGINFFTKDDQDIFCGRADDAQKLFNRIMLNNTVVLHGESGTGKSSLVQAGILPLLDKHNDYLSSQRKPQFLPVTIRLDAISKKAQDDHGALVEGDILISQIMNGINKCKDYKAKALPYISEKTDSFWYTAKLFEKNNYALLLILDQFEELQGYSSRDALAFTKKLFELFVSPMPEEIYEEYDNKTAALASAKKMSEEEQTEFNDNIQFLEQPLNLRILFVVREDKLGTMSLLADYFPDILKNDFFLLPLNGKGAKSAIIEPARTEGNFIFEPFEYDDPAVKNLLLNLADANHLYDPIQLQIVCSSIERKISANDKLINEEDLPKISDIIRDFYYDSWKKIQDEFKLSEDDYEKKRKAIIGTLVVSNSRNLVLEKLLINDSDGLDLSIVKSLVRDGLLRKIPQGPDTFYQLSHDRIMAPLNDDLIYLITKEQAKEQQEDLRLQLQLMSERRQRQRKINIGMGIAFVIMVALTAFLIYATIDANDAKEAAQQSLIKSYNAEIAKYQGEIRIIDKTIESFGIYEAGTDVINLEKVKRKGMEDSIKGIQIKIDKIEMSKK